MAMPSAVTAQFKNNEWVGHNAFSEYDRKHKERVPPQYLIKANFISGYMTQASIGIQAICRGR